MNYGFTVAGATKAEAKTAVATKLHELTARQLIHESDHALVSSIVDAEIGLLTDANAGQKIAVDVALAIWGPGGKTIRLTGAGVEAQASWFHKRLPILTREQAAEHSDLISGGDV